MALEQQVFQSRPLAKIGRAAQLQEQIKQSQAQIEGLELQRSAVEWQIAISAEEMTLLESLRNVQLVETSRLTSLSKQQAELPGCSG